MTTIELTKEHNSKLLEMCKVLFPEYKDLVVRDSMEDFCFDFEHICIEFNRKKELVIIHWFEFCMTHLAVAISKIKDYPSDLIDRNEFIKGIIEQSYNTHPIDYLYKEFKH